MTEKIVRRRCSLCGKLKPQTAEFFPRESKCKSTGLKAICRLCHTGREADRVAGLRAEGGKYAKVSVSDAVKMQADEDTVSTQRVQLKEYAREIRFLRTQLSAASFLKDAPPGRFVVTPKRAAKVSEATAVACLSDVHVGETVIPEQVNGMNEYSVAICRERCSRFFERVVRLTEKERQDVEIRELILFLGGDLIDGALHMDTIMHNEVAAPMKQAAIAQEIVSAGLDHLIRTGKFARITVVCKDGNHGRVTQRLHHASRTGNSLEWILYRNLRDRFPDLNWIIEENLHTYLKVYDKVVRFHHGDTIAYGGMNGFFTYLNRRRFQWNSGRRADLDVLGHLHQYTATKRFVVNGSVVGHNPFAVSIGAEFEAPMQAYFLLDKRRGLTVTIPILLD